MKSSLSLAAKATSTASFAAGTIATFAIASFAGKTFLSFGMAFVNQANHVFETKGRVWNASPFRNK